MTLEERFEAVMRNCEHIQARNEELANQNEYLRRQLGDSLRQKRRELRSSSSSRPRGSGRGEEGEEGPLSGRSQSEEDSPRHPRSDGGPSMELQNSPKGVKSRAKITEEVQALVEAAAASPGYTPMRKHDFVIQIANDPGGVAAHSDHGQVA